MFTPSSVPGCLSAPNWFPRLRRLVVLLLIGGMAAGCDSGGSSSPSPEAPRAPSTLEARADGEAIALEWSSSSQSSSSEPVRFNVYRATDSIQSPSGREPLNDAPLEEPSFTDPGATPWQPYRYGVTAVRGSGEQVAESGLSEQVQYTLPQVEYVLEAPDPQGPAQFGVPIGFAGDRTGDGTEDLTVGTFAPNGASRRVYLASGADGALLRRVRPDGLSTGELFGPLGANVGDLDGDGTEDLAVATFEATAGGVEQAGQLHLISGADGSVLWTRESPSPEEGGRFGFPSPLGDLNGDGTPDLAVGAPGESADGVEGAGRLYLLDGTDGTVLNTLSSPDPQQGAGFGLLVAFTDRAPTGSALRPDFNGDDAPDVLVQVVNRDVNGAENAGRIYLFDGASLRQRQELETIRILESPNSESGGQFGAQPSLTGDVDGDGTPDLLLGAPSETVQGRAGAGRAYLLSGGDGSVIRALRAPTPETNAGFGSAVGSADANQDGTPDLAVRALEAAGGFSRAGRIYLFDGAALRDGDAPEQAVLRRFVSPRPEPDGFLGTDVEILPGAGLLVSGANGEESGGTEDAGRLYAFPLIGEGS